jgi:hypothetical protein
MTPRPYRPKRRKRVINLDEVVIGDQIELVDKDGNRLIGTVDGAPGVLWAAALDTRVVFAKLGAGGEWVARPGVKIAWHQPSLVGLPET